MRCEEHPMMDATWHVRYICELHDEDEIFVACTLCWTSLMGYKPEHGEVVVAHLFDSDCKHPDATWLRDGCIVPTTEITIEDLVTEKEPVPA